MQAFEQLIGPVDKVQVEWHDYVRRLKTAISKRDVKFFRDGQLPEASNAGSRP